MMADPKCGADRREEAVGGHPPKNNTGEATEPCYNNPAGQTDEKKQSVATHPKKNNTEEAAEPCVITTQRVFSGDPPKKKDTEAAGPAVLAQRVLRTPNASKSNKKKQKKTLFFFGVVFCGTIDDRVDHDLLSNRSSL